MTGEKEDQLAISQCLDLETTRAWLYSEICDRFYRIEKEEGKEGGRMGREMNPRAWSIDGECWCTRVDYDGYKEEWSGIAPVFAPDNRSKYIGEIEDTNIIVEFPTGLKDKNGKEIYENCELDGRYIAKYIAPCFVGIDIVNGDIIELYDNKFTITKEHSELSQNSKRGFD